MRDRNYDNLASLQDYIENNIVLRTTEDDSQADSYSNEYHYYCRMRNLIDPIWILKGKLGAQIDDDTFSEYLYQVLDISRMDDITLVFPENMTVYKPYIEEALFDKPVHSHEKLDENDFQRVDVCFEENDNVKKIYDRLINAAHVFKITEPYGTVLEAFVENLINISFKQSGHIGYISPYYRASCLIESSIKSLGTIDRQHFLKKMKRSFKVWMNYLQREYRN